jgi:agmatine deiminase
MSVNQALSLEDGSMAQTLKEKTPREDGFRMPGEFEAHAGCWMLWPERGDNWRLGAKPAQQCFVAIATAIARFEPVTMGVSRAHYEDARHQLPDAIRVVEMAHDDAWMRDVGPTFVVHDRRGLVAGVDWGFNAWGGLDGGLYFPWHDDDLVAGKVLEIAGADRYRAPLVLEGGSIHVDGEGTLLTTEECLLNPNRNPSLSRAQIEACLRGYLDVERIVWLPRGVYLDETDGHVDNLCCFARPGVVLLSWTDDPEDPVYAICREARAILEKERDARGRPFEVHPVQQPGPLFQTAEESAGLAYSGSAKPRRPGDRLAGSYINFYIANGGVVMPLLDEARDAAAVAAVQACFPDREVVGVPAREVLLGGGNIHCITQQQPIFSPSA